MAHNRATVAFVKSLTDSGLLKAAKADWSKSLSNALFPFQRYNQYGLFYDDILIENEVVKEALRRLPKEVYHERTYRITRAIDVSAKKGVLPKDQWTKREEDLPYLKAYIEEVEREHKEKEAWEAGLVKI